MRSKSLTTLFNVFQLGLVLGVLFVKTEVARWERIHQMFLFQESRMYLIIALAILVAGVSMRLLKRVGARSLDGQEISYSPKPLHKGVVLGGYASGPDCQAVSPGHYAVGDPR